MTISCRDADELPKVANAGSFLPGPSVELQVMHNGLLIERGCYYGPWMDEIIRSLRGHHEPQEELVFSRVIDRLHATGGASCSVEFGSFWAFYTMWFATEFPGARAIALEPDPAYLAIGKRNAALNGLSDAITFGAGAVGDQPGATVSFTAESDGQPYEIKQYDLASTMEEFDLEHVDLLMVDIQGFEQVLLPRAVEQFKDGKVRFLIVSTHHHDISGNPTTHQDMLSLLTGLGAHIIAEHSVSESFSGDGLIAASFDPRDQGFSVQVSHNRASTSLFPPAEEDLARSRTMLDEARRQLAEANAERAALAVQLEAIRSTKVWRWSAPARRIAAAVRATARRS